MSLLAPSAWAQDAAPATPSGCELHVWPGSDLVYLYFGWFHGGTVNGAVKGREGYPTPPENPLTLEIQGKLLAEMDLPAQLNLPGYAVVMHPNALSSREIRSSATRLAESSSPCYAEFMIDDLLLSENVIGGNALRASFRFRDFGPDAAPRRQFGNFVMTKLLGFPPKTPDAMTAAVAELKAAFRSDVTQFTAAATRPPKRK